VAEAEKEEWNMKTKSLAAKAAAISAFALLAACGTGQGDTSVGTTGSTGTGTAREAMVTLRGVNGEDVRSALLTLSNVQVSADGQAVDARVDGRTIDLADGEMVATRFAVPQGVATVHVVLTFDDFGGYELKNGTAGEVDARGTRVLIDLPAETLASSGKAQVALDLSRSLIEGGRARQMLAPHFELTY
jgi:hypothetical protein